LFSATLAAPIRRIAQRHLRSPVEVTVKSKTSTATNIHQRYWVVSGVHKLDALTRILEAETFDGMLVFTRTKQSTVELAEKLEARGFAAAPLNGDIAQPLRERTVARLKSGQIDIVVATDVAARGLDVERIGHVVNYDVPYDTESYVHRVGRTGRAGRKGEAILFIAPRERNMLRAIERATRQTIEQMNLPSVDAVNVKRTAKFKQRVTEVLAKREIDAYKPVLEQLEAETGKPLIDIAAALASLAQGTTPLLLAARPDRRPEQPPHAARPAAEPAVAERAAAERAAVERAPLERGAVERPKPKPPSADKETFRIAVGSIHGVKPGNIVGAIANEADIEGVHIGRVDIRDDHSYVDLPGGMPKAIFNRLQKVRVVGRELRLTPVTEKPPKAPRSPVGRHKDRKLLTRR
jgi:ATP-dependent RNA helicase DeaD